MQATRVCGGSGALRWPMMFFAPRRRGGSRTPSSAASSPLSSSIAPPPGGAGADDDDDLPAPSLLLRLAGGDLSALDALYRRESGRVYRYALALSGNAAWAADATQEAFVALATRPEGFDATRGQLGAYLAGVARHALSARWRELRREEPLGATLHSAANSDEAGLADGAPLNVGAAAFDIARAADAATPETLLVRTQETQALWAALRALPAVFREAVVLVDLQERPYAEAAQIAGIELNTLRTRLHRARARLARLLGAEPADVGAAAATAAAAQPSAGS